MLFDVTKFYIKGKRDGETEIVEMKFPSLKIAELWAEKTSLDKYSTYLVIDILIKSKYISK